MANKYGAQPAIYNGQRYDSTYEATVAKELDLRLKAKDIAGWDRQYVCTIMAYRYQHTPAAYTQKHRVDFRIHHNDGTFELVEVKGVETRDWKMTRKLLEALWLPEHPDHRYTVVKQAKYFNKNGWR